MQMKCVIMQHFNLVRVSQVLATPGSVPKRCSSDIEWVVPSLDTNALQFQPVTARRMQCSCLMSSRISEP